MCFDGVRGSTTGHVRPPPRSRSYVSRRRHTRTHFPARVRRNTGPNVRQQTTHSWGRRRPAPSKDHHQHITTFTPTPKGERNLLGSLYWTIATNPSPCASRTSVSRPPPRRQLYRELQEECGEKKRRVWTVRSPFKRTHMPRMHLCALQEKFLVRSMLET